ncbi:arrestin domain-containing protein 17-like [Schistocerca nitens]|uniref:arrestin domain-containing protein 17-like n=1 Tax=Schistocerca nitens TaxID=7011 RepID=UPI002118075F|nr:arrestin domain-containing protein 17-like [Schistocerca nitens]
MVRQIRIYLDNPVATYYGGDTVTGKVVVKTDEEEKIRYISAKCRGEANVRWTRRVRRRGHTKHIRYSAHENYFETKYYFVGGPSEELILPPGEHVYNFSVKLPENLPSSFEGTYGHIRYTIKAKMNRPWAFDEKVKAFYTVLSHLDLNTDPLVKEPVSQVTEKTLCCCWCRSGPLTLVAKVPATGFVSGQEIPVTVEVDNATEETISAVTCSLKKNVCFTAHSPRKETKRITDKMETIVYEPVGPNASRTWTRKLKIPSLPPSNLNNCSIIDLDYFLHVKAVINGPHRNLHVNIPIKLGTIPLLSYIPPPLSKQIMSSSIQTPQLPSLQDAPVKFPQSSAASAPCPPPQTQYSTAPCSSNIAAVMPPSTSQQGMADGLSNELNIVPSAPPLPYPEVPPPSYEECVYGASNIDDEEDTRHYQDDNRFVPRYPTYNLHFEKGSGS